MNEQISAYAHALGVRPDSRPIEGFDFVRIAPCAWVKTPPTKPGVYLWRKNAQWEPVEREVREIDGTLQTFAQRVQNWVPLAYLEAGGSEWACPQQ